MVPRKKGQKYEISYRCPNYEKPFSERFDSYEAAKLRIAQIEYEKSLGTFEPPKRASLAPKKTHYVTVAELLDEYVQLYGLKHWGDSYLSSSQHYIAHYIKPTIGDVLVKDVTTHGLDVFYDKLLDQPAVVLKGHRKKDKKISPTVIVKIHALMSGAFKRAIGWRYIDINPAENVTLPQRVKKERDSWSASEVKYALAICENPVLKLAMLLALGCSMRIGEILGLTWDCIDLSEESLSAGNASLFINKELKRCQKSSLEALEKRGRSKVLFAFPAWKQTDCTTALVLKTPKTESSVRVVFLPRTVAAALIEAKKQQDEEKMLLGSDYKDFNLVLAQSGGRPYEPRQIDQMLSTFIQENELRSVVFHSLRHSSTSIKLQISCGNIKAVQGDTDHAQARTVTEVYAHTNNKERLLLAQKVDENFFQTPTPGHLHRPARCKKFFRFLLKNRSLSGSACRHVAAAQAILLEDLLETSEKSDLQKKEKILETIAVSRIFLELLGRFELPTSSLPMTRSTD